MEFLKEILGDAYAEFEKKVNAYNEANKDKPIKIANLSTGEYVSKDKHTTLETEANGYKTQLSSLNEQIETLKKATGTDETLKVKLQELQDKYDTDTETLNKQLEGIKFDSTLELALTGSGAKSTKALRGLLDMDKIKLDGDTLIGLDEQLKSIQETESYLFADDKTSSTSVKTGQEHKQQGTNELDEVQQQVESILKEMN